MAKRKMTAKPSGDFLPHAEAVKEVLRHRIEASFKTQEKNDEEQKYRWMLTVIAKDPNGGYDYSQYNINGFGEMVDILYEQYMGIPIEHFFVDHK